MATAEPLPTLAVTIADVRAAAARVAGAVVRTPTLRSGPLSRLSGADVFIKYENLQVTAAYKERGALNRLLQMEEGLRARGVIAASAGNHAQGLAYHGALLSVPVTIVMPRQTPVVKVAQTEGHGANVVLHGDTFDEAYAHARQLERERGLTFVHPFDDAAIIAGQGTVALEMLEDAPQLDALLVSIGGGGLIAGMATAARAVKPAIDIIGVQAETYPSSYAAFTGQAMEGAGDTIAEGIAVKQPGALTSAIIRALVDDVVLVSETAIEQAVSLLFQFQKTVVEGAGAAGLAALLTDPDRFRGRAVGLVLTGGNIDTRLLANILLRDLARSGRLARLRIQLQDRPGTLHSVVRLFDDHQVNIIEIDHHRLFTELPTRGVYIDVECEARDRAHLGRLIAALEGDGFNVHPVEIH